MAKTEVTIPLGIPDVRVLKSEAGERGEIIITIESTKTGTSCRQCGKWITKRHGQEDWVMDSDTYRPLDVPLTCAIVPGGINVRNVKGIPQRPKSWNGRMPIVHTVLLMTTISCCN